MAQKLSKLLDRPETQIAAVIRKLEDMCGYPSADVGLLSEINLKIREKTASLGLDPDDTTSKELYHGLRARYLNDERRISAVIGLHAENVSDYEFAQKVTQFVLHADIIHEAWALKRSVAKDILRNRPPRQLMKKLNYRSAESMLKRENVSEVYAVLPYTESDRWLKDFWKALSKVKSTDFESRPLEILVASPKLQVLIKGKTKQIVGGVPHMGAVIINSPAKARKLGVLGLSSVIIDNINNLRIYNAFAKLHQVERNLGEVLVRMLHEGVKAPAELVKLPISWATILNYFGQKTESEFSEIFGPHLAHEDIQLIESTKALVRLHPAIAWWSGLDHVAAYSNKNVISFNLRDVISNEKTNASHHKNSRNHLENGLWSELINRYLAYPGFQAFVMDEVSASSWKPSEPAIPTFSDFDYSIDFKHDRQLTELRA